MVKHVINSIILLEQQRISAALFYAQHITLPRSTVNILIDRLRDNFTFPYLGTTSGSSWRGGEPFGRARRSACCHGQQPYMPALVPFSFPSLDTKENKAGSQRVLRLHFGRAQQPNDAQLITFSRGADFAEGINA